MHLVSKIMKVGGSLALVIPPEVIKEMDILPKDTVIIKYTHTKMNISKLKDIMNKKEDNRHG